MKRLPGESRAGGQETGSVEVASGHRQVREKSGHSIWGRLYIAHMAQL